MSRLAEPLRGVLGPTAKVLENSLGLRTVEDLLRHYPRRYAERGELTDLAALRPGEYVTVLAEVVETKTRQMKYRKGSVLEVFVGDGRGRTSQLSLTFFNQKGGWREKLLRPGRRGLFAGKVEAYGSRRQLTHPDYQLLGEDEDADAIDAAAYAGELLAVYPASKQVRSWTLADSVRVVLDTLGEVEDPVPERLRAQRGLLSLGEAFRLVHRPGSREDVRRARERLRWDEAFLLQVALARRRAEQRALPAIPRPARPGGLLEAFDARLPFELTAGQREVGSEILDDLAGNVPMQRLLQGEVGSGKTVLALRAMLAVVDSGGQAALLAPTEVLAQQHHRTITGMLGPLAQRGWLGGAEEATRVALLTGSQGTAARRAALLDAVSGEAGIVVGTHALLQDPVGFADLGLVVVDEQHRFGVEQRDALRAKAGTPAHLLVMTATPIPRTVAMTVFGDLDVSTLAELPAGRLPVRTVVVPLAEQPPWRERVWQRVREEVAGGRQVYVVCPRVGGDGQSEQPGGSGGEGPNADAADDRRPPLAVLDVAPALAEGPLQGLRVDVLHGQLPAEEKDVVMRRFAEGGSDVLVATTVVEVGVDVANATGMVVLDADRFGISQLHQLRGRVGRGTAPGLCLLVTELPAGSPGRERLEAVAATNDGFELARLDLEQRREGDVLGSSQSGRRSSLRLLTVLRDEQLVREARDEAVALVADDPTLAAHPVLAQVLDRVLDEERTGYLEKA